MLMTSRRVFGAVPSATLAVSAKARERGERGLEVISFAAGEPDFETPEHIKQAAVKALADGWTRYPPVNGLAALREAIAEDSSNRLGISYRSDEVLVTVGAKQAIYNLCQVVLEEGTEAVIPSPYWVSYPEVVQLAGAKPVFVTGDAQDGFVPRMDRLEQAINDRTRLLFLNSPSNPSGAVLPKKMLESLAELLRRYPKVMVLTDDIYSRIRYSTSSFVNIAVVAPDLRDRIVIIDGVSKVYAMTGWRVGWALAPKGIIDAMAIIQGQSTSGVAPFAQAGAISALKGDQGIVKEMLKQFELRRDRMISRLNAIEGISCRSPDGAFYAFPDMRGLLNKRYADVLLRTTQELAAHLIDKHGVAVVDGLPFGADGFVRLSFATSIGQIDRGLDLIEVFLQTAN